jgi:lipopolysaccharide biosynthesis glycosyltransferase
MSAPDGSNVIQVVLAADANYVIPLAVAISSVATNCDRKRGLVFYVIQSEIYRDLRIKVESSLERTGFPNARINWLDAPVERITGFKLAHRHTTCLTFARLVIHEMLPVEVEKAIYLDCDLVVNGDIGELWDTTIGEKSIFAVRDSTGFVSEPDGLVNYRELGIPAESHYFNAGVLLMNLKKWRECETGERIIKYLSNHRAIIQMADQEALNAVLWDDWGELEYRWNWQILHRNYRLGRIKPSWVPEASQKSIVHFTTGEKPWLPGCDYDERKYFFQYLDQTEWAGLRVSWRRELFKRSRIALSDARAAIRMLRQRLIKI